MSRLVLWNIRQGGGERIAAVADALVSAEPDIVVIAEYRPHAGARALGYRLAQAGLVHQRAASVAPSLNSVFVASRDPIEPEPDDWWPADDHWRMLPCRIGGVRLLATYFPAVAPYIAHAFEPLLKQTAEWVIDRCPTLLVGDLNAGDCANGDLQSGTFSAGENFRRLLASGWVDLWRRGNPDALEFSWVSRSKWGESGFRLDHALALNWPDQWNNAVRYDHRVRESKISDHSMLVVEWLDAVHQDVL